MSKANVKKSEDGATVIVTLKRPIEHLGKLVTEVRLRTDVTVADLEAMDKAKGDIERQLRLLAELSGMSIATFRRMRPVDFGELGEVALELLGEDQQIGETSPQI